MRCASASRARSGSTTAGRSAASSPLFPYAAVQNKDSHLLRQSPADLGPAPNVVTESSYAYGVEPNCSSTTLVTPNIEIGAGVRYWGLRVPHG